MLISSRNAVVFSLVAMLWASSAGLAEDKRPPVAGWYDLFPVLSPPLRMSPRYEHLVVPKGKEGETAYSQSAHYDAATGLQRSFRVTITRDPEVKKRYNAEALKGVAAESQIDKRTVWTWNDGKQIAIVLGDDKAVILTTDPRSVKMPLADYVKAFDFSRIEKALAKPPRTELELTLESFAVLKKGASIRSMSEWCGNASKYEKIDKKEENRARWTYNLKDGSTVVAITMGAFLETLTHETADGKKIDLLK